MKHLSVAELIGAAGGDPWQVNDTIAAGSPGEISELATSFHNAAVCTTQTGEEFAQAKKRFAEAWDRDDPAHPINDADEVRRATESLHMSSQQMGRVAVDLQDIAADLAEAQRSGHISIGNLEARLTQIDDLIESELQAAAAAGHQLDSSELKRAAVDATKHSLGEMTALRNAYGAKLDATQREMAADGYDTDTVNGAVPNSPAAQSNERHGSQPGSLDDALDQIAGAPVPAAAPAPQRAPMDPKDVETFKAMARKVLEAQDVPADQIESRLTAMVAQAQQGLGRPSHRAPDPPRQPPPGFGEGFADRWFSTEQGIKNLLGQGGPGAPGVLESWGGLLQGTAETVVNPAGAAVEEIKNAVNSPSPAYYLGEKTFDAASTAVTLPWGGEGAAIRDALPVRTIVEGGAPEALVRGWHPTGGMPSDEFGPRFGAPGSRIWPENNGFPPGYEPQPVQLPAGTIIDRFGHEGGRYLAPDGTLFADRALSPETVSVEYHRYSVTGKPLPDGWQILEGPVEPWYGQTPSPGTVQYMIVGPDGVKVDVEELVDKEILTDHGPVLGYEYK
ncbi:TNT domain-containing protein [Mycolicibacterium stellerae]|uniref:TNT domain-containing protein n=1 Tax=Mycolicibacterium stellerae TaxID=2358193 RepID=UPI001F2E89AA|nr:TNT domain-containing protein [Mycolicibacterium stellerae]